MNLISLPRGFPRLTAAFTSGILDYAFTEVHVNLLESVRRRPGLLEYPVRGNRTGVVNVCQVWRRARVAGLFSSNVRLCGRWNIWWTDDSSADCFQHIQSLFLDNPIQRPEPIGVPLALFAVSNKRLKIVGARFPINGRVSNVLTPGCADRYERFAGQRGVLSVTLVKLLIWIVCAQPVD